MVCSRYTLIDEHSIVFDSEKQKRISRSFRVVRKGLKIVIFRGKYLISSIFAETSWNYYSNIYFVLHFHVHHNIRV